MATIKKVLTSKDGSYVFGTNFRKGDFIATMVKYWFRLDDHRTVEVDRDSVKELIGGNPKYITDKRLDSLKGKTYNG